MKTDIILSIALDDVEKMSAVIKALECRLETAEDALVRERKGFDDYRSAEAEREANVLKRNEETLQHQLAVMTKNERKNAALEEYLSAKSHYVSVIHSIVEKRLTKAEKQKMNAEKRRVDAAWAKFDKVQKECAK